MASLACWRNELTRKLVLYYDGRSGYLAEIPELVQLLHSLKARWGIEFEEVPRERMTGESETSLKSVIYQLQLHPHRRGDIVTSQGDMLPLTQNKNLNIGNTPILLVEDDGKPLDVLPKRVQGLLTGVRAGLVEMLQNGPQFEKPIFSAENLAISRIVKDPRVIEEGLEIVGQEVEVSAGKIDLLAKDRNQRLLVIEFKRQATDASIGQVIRLTASLAEREKVSPSVIRKMILCGRMNDHLRIAAKSVDIEVRVLPSFFSEK